MPDPELIAKHIKSLCYFLDSDMVGICECPDWVWYSEDLDGEPIEAKHKYAIVVVNDQRWEALDSSSGDDWVSDAPELPGLSERIDYGRHRLPTISAGSATKPRRIPTPMATWVNPLIAYSPGW